MRSIPSFTSGPLPAVSITITGRRLEKPATAGLIRIGSAEREQASASPATHPMTFRPRGGNEQPGEPLDAFIPHSARSVAKIAHSEDTY